jgi:lathosterol oxidase
MNVSAYTPLDAPLIGIEGLEIADVYLQHVMDLIASTNELGLLKQYLVLSLVVAFWAYVLFFVFCSISYYIFFVRWKHIFRPDSEPQVPVGQVRREIMLSMWSLPTIAFLTSPWFMLQLHGYSQLYIYDPTVTWTQTGLTVLAFIVFTDSCIYWIHRWEHTFPWIYKNIHKPHHEWKVPSPYASYAFHPLDGYAQSVPYHLFVIFCPMNVFVYMLMFVLVQLWTIGIHDSVDFIGDKKGSWISKIVNGSMHHTIHHSKFIYNYGQYFTFWDKLLGSHYEPCLDYEGAKKTQ